MKIAVPVDENQVDTNVCISFGRAPYFLIHDTETKESKFIKNEAAMSAGGAGIKAAQTLVDSGIEILLTPRCGENAADVLLSAGVKLYKTEDGSAQENLVAFSEGKLALLEEVHAGFHTRAEE